VRQQPRGTTTVTPLAAVNDSSRDLAYQVAATQYLSRTEALLTSFRADARPDARDAARFAAQARDLLTTAQLMLDSPAGDDPRMRAHARVIAGWRIEHQLSGGQQVPRLGGKASGVAGIGPRIGAKRRQQRFRPRQVLRSRHLIGEVARRVVHRGERGDSRRAARLLAHCPAADPDAEHEHGSCGYRPAHPRT